MDHQAANHERYEQWVRAHTRPLYSFAYRLAGQHTVAEDLVQECFAEAWRSMTSLRDPAKARGWLFQILRHRFSHHVAYRMRSHATVALPDNSDDHPRARNAEVVKQLGDRELLQKGLMALSTDLRQTFVMVYVEQLTCRETADALGIPLGTVLSRLDAARRKLRQSLCGDSHPSSGGGTPKVAL